MSIEPFLLRALLGGLAIATMAGPLGCFVVWRRMAYFGDSLAHSALLGIVLGIAIGVGVNIGIVVVCLAFASLLWGLQRKRILATDTLLGIMAHTALSLGMVVMGLIGLRINIHQFLFGDILALTQDDLITIYMGGAFILLSLCLFWRSLLLVTIHEGIARAEGIKVGLANFALVILMTCVVALSIQLVGILLITSLLIIPAATARLIAKSPEQMAIIAACVGGASVVLGLLGSYYLDTISGPSIVVSAALLFILVSLTRVGERS